MKVPDSAGGEPGQTVSLIMACRNEAGEIERCLESILQQNGFGPGWELLVADGLSDDGTRSLLEGLARRDGRIRIIQNEGRIVSTGLNAAIKEARGETILRLDAHTAYAADYVESCLRVSKKTGAENVGGPARTRATTRLQRAIAAAYHSPFAVGGARFHNVEYEGCVDTVPYGCWPSAVFRRFGQFDPELVRNQDDEFNLRIIRGGGKIWQSPEIKSWYSPRSSLRSLFKQYSQYGYWKVRVIQKHHLPASIRHLVPGGFLLSLALLLVLAPFFFWARLALILALSSYGLGLLAASVSAGRSAGWDLLPLLPAVFACYHFGYGSGFLRGLFDFCILGRASANLGALSRPTAAVKGAPVRTD